LAPKEEDPILDQQKSIVLKLANFQLKALAMSSGEDLSYLQEIQEALQDDPFVENIRKRLRTNEVNDEFEFKDGLLYFKGFLYIPPGPTRLKIIQMRHDLPTVGHFGFNKTMELISQDFWWPQMWKLVKEFIQSCDTCTRGKVPRHRPYGLLHPLPIPKGSWLSLSIDFITDLPLANGKDSIFVVVDRLTKIAHFIPYTKTITVEETAKLFLTIFIVFIDFQMILSWTRGLNLLLISGEEFFQLLGMKINLSTACHPRTDGQIERVNQILKQYLYCTVNYQQDDWIDLLPLAEFAYNNIVHSSTKQTPFFSNYGHHLRADPFQVKDVGSPTAEDLATHLAAIHDELAFQLYEAQDHYKDYADRNRKIHSNFHIGDYVWLLRRNIQTKRPSKKLDYQ
jgi:hypothetical protein